MSSDFIRGYEQAREDAAKVAGDDAILCETTSTK